MLIVTQDPTPQRDHIFFVSGLEEGTQHSGLLACLERAKLGRLRLNFRSHGTQARISCLQSCQMGTSWRGRIIMC